MQSNHMGFLDSYYKIIVKISRQPTTMMQLSSRRAFLTHVKSRVASLKKKIKPPTFSVTKIHHNLFLSGAPTDNDHCCILNELKFQGVVCFLESHEIKIPVQEYGINVLLLPTPDYTSPTNDQLRLAIKFISENIHANVLLHCKAGEGRSAICAAAFLCSQYKMTPDDAYQYIKDRRRISLIVLRNKSVLQQCFQRGTDF